MADECRVDRGVTAGQLARQPPPTVSFDDSVSTFPPIADYAFLSDCETTAVARRYLPGTMVLETTWSARSGWLVVRDALLIGPWHHPDGRSESHRRAPTDYEAEHVLLRELHCSNGEVQVALECAPVFGYGKRVARWTYGCEGSGEASARGGDGEPELRLVSDMRLGWRDQWLSPARGYAPGTSASARCPGASIHRRATGTRRRRG